LVRGVVESGPDENRFFVDAQAVASLSEIQTDSKSNVGQICPSPEYPVPERNAPKCFARELLEPPGSC